MSKTAASPTLEGYWRHSQQPLQAMLFLLPLIVLYELALPYFGHDRVRDAMSDIYARRLLYRFFEMLGVSGYYLPGLIVIVVLLSWHFARRDPWRVRPGLYGWMTCESLLLSLPLFVFQMVLFRHVAMMALQAGGSGGPHWRAEVIFAVGAGIYEEMLFRLIGITLLHLLLADLLAIPRRFADPAAVIVAALLFAFYHFPDGFDSPRNPFAWGKFIFYTAAGVYFGVIFVWRGFGIAAGTHAMYDLLLVMLVQLRG